MSETLDPKESGGTLDEAWVVVLHGERTLAKSAGRFYATRAGAEASLACRWPGLWEVRRVLVEWPEG